MDIPSWVSIEAWGGYVEMRKKIKRPMTEYAMKLAIKKLDKLRRQGYDPSMVLDQSTFESWQGLFPLREEPSGDRASRKTFDAMRRESSLTSIRRVAQDYLPLDSGIQRALPKGSKRLLDEGVH